jgi:hypothetical protein
MPTFAADQDEQLLREELGRRTRAAWDAYRDATRNLEGRPYDEAEAEAWNTLQRRLAELAH